MGLVSRIRDVSELADHFAFCLSSSSVVDAFVDVLTDGSNGTVAQSELADAGVRC